MPDDNGITLADAKTQLAAWMTADAAVSRGQSVDIDGTRLTRADANAITAKINYWQLLVNRLTSGGVRVRGVTFL